MSLEDGAQLPKDTWIHLAFVADTAADEMVLYMDGNSQGTDQLGAFDLSDTTGAPPDYSFSIGAWSNTYPGGGVDALHNSLIDEVAVWNRALTSTEVLALATAISVQYRHQAWE